MNINEQLQSLIKRVSELEAHKETTDKAIENLWTAIGKTPLANSPTAKAEEKPEHN